MTKDHYFKGKCKWAKLITPDTKFEPTGVWSIQLYPDAASLSEIMKLKENVDGVAGLMNHIKKDDDGTYISFKCKANKEFRGVKKAFPPPQILDADGKPAPSLRIGNCSDVTVKVEVYSYKLKIGSGRGTAARLLAVRVDNLVPFKESDYTPEEAENVEGLAEQPKPLF